MASNEDTRKVIEEIEKIQKQIRNSKLKLKRRIRNLEKTFNPVEKGRIEFEIEMLKDKIRRWEIVESKLSIPLLKSRIDTFMGEWEGKIDWSKAAKARGSEDDSMRYSILKCGRQMLTEIKDVEQAKKEAVALVVPKRSDFIENRDSDNQTATIGYFDGSRFHWTRDKVETEAWKSCSFVTRPLLWSGAKILKNNA